MLPTQACPEPAFGTLFEEAQWIAVQVPPAPVKDLADAKGSGLHAISGRFVDEPPGGVVSAVLIRVAYWSAVEFKHDSWSL
jgi:hypothetical protein